MIYVKFLKKRGNDRNPFIWVKYRLHYDEINSLGLLHFDGVDAENFDNERMRIFDEVSEVVPETNAM